MSEVDLEAVRKFAAARLGKFASLEEFLSYAMQAQGSLIQLADEVERRRTKEAGLQGELAEEVATTAKLSEENARLREALELYGNHLDICSIGRVPGGRLGCNCGLAAALADKPEESDG